MKKVQSLIFMLLGLHVVLFAQNSGVEFREFDNFKDLIQVAQNEDKEIFVNLHYVGCPHCVRMDKNVFPNNEVGKLYNENFVCVSLDINTDSLGVFFEREYTPLGYPAFLYFDKDGNLLQKTVGYKVIDEFINIAKTLPDFENSFAQYQNKVDVGDLSSEVLSKYLSTTYVPEKGSLINEYMTNCTEEERYSEDTWKMLSSVIRSDKDSSFKFIKDNESKFRQTVGDKAVDNYLVDILTFKVNPWSSWWANDFQRRKTKKELRATNNPLAERVINRVDFMVRLERAGWRINSKRKWKKMIQETESYMAHGYDDWYNYYRASALILNSYERRGKPEDLNLGLALAEKSVGSRKEFMNMLFYALALKRVGAGSKAVEALQEAFNYETEQVERGSLEYAKKTLKEWSSE
ncbi:MAG: thioredoxin family protein [Bacteroidales bacterium]